MKYLKAKNIDKGFIARFFVCFSLIASLLSCEDMLKTDTDYYSNTDGHELNSPNDTLYSMVGILRKLQTVADSYVLTGELRGELMDITENADMDLQAIYNFNVKETDKNPYTDTRPWYDIINNCNFFIRRADTTATIAGQGVMTKELAAVKAIRAWVYMQLLLNYGKACYYVEPILTLQDRDKIKNDPEAWISNPETLLQLERETLLEAREVQRERGNPNYSEMPGIDYAFIPAALVLADLYLHTGNPTAAAAQYHDFLYTGRFSTRERKIFWGNAGFTAYSTYISDQEYISNIYTTTENETGSQLTGWCYPEEWSNAINVNCTYRLKPSTASMDIWNRQMYAFLPGDATPQDEPTYTTGDLRGKRHLFNGGYSVSVLPPFSGGNLFQAYAYFTTSASDSLPFIMKYGAQEGRNYTNVAYIYRVAGVYLRYAEALNRLGKSTLAFAILKYGVSNTLFYDPAKVKPEEVNPLPDYCNFPEAIFPLSRAQGIHSRGTGEADRNEFYVIPAGCDTVRFVDEAICEEMALEAAFEGNRFHDLMRFAGYYGNDFLASRVANRRGTEDVALKAKLMDRQNWFLPHP